MQLITIKNEIIGFLSHKENQEVTTGNYETVR